MFWESHDPTSGNRQGFDVGSQYRSAIYATTDAQFKSATASKQRLTESKKFRRPITTEIRKGIKFYMAEDYHQQYVDKRNGVAACPIPGF